MGLSRRNQVLAAEFGGCRTMVRRSPAQTKLQRSFGLAMTITMRPVLIFLLAFLVGACGNEGDLPRTEIEDRLEVVSEQQETVNIRDLRTCLEHRDCDDRDTAKVDLGILLLSRVERQECRWTSGKADTLVPMAKTRLKDASETGQTLTLEEWIAEGPDQAGLQVIEESLINPAKFSCDFDDVSPEFKEGYALLEKAAAAGNKEAANEIGVLSINDPDLFDLTYARSVLEPCHAAGGGFCALNLARIESLEADDGCGRCLGLLRIAATRTGDKGIRFMYDLAKRRLGRGAVVGRVFVDFEHDGGVQRYLGEFDTMFPRLALDAGGL